MLGKNIAHNLFQKLRPKWRFIKSSPVSCSQSKILMETSYLQTVCAPLDPGYDGEQGGQMSFKKIAQSVAQPMFCQN
jgi:hypothetical protein